MFSSWRVGGTWESGFLIRWTIGESFGLRISKGGQLVETGSLCLSRLDHR